MEELYSLLKNHNIKFASEHSNLPNWFMQFTEPEPPKYWQTVFNVLEKMPKNQLIVEIGSGFGNITCILYHLKFEQIISFEQDISIGHFGERLIRSLFDKKATIIKEHYPVKLNFTPDILLQVNCVYADNISNKSEYINQLRQFYQYNGVPKTYIVELIDSSFKEFHSTFPYYIRLNENDISNIFTSCEIFNYETYSYPINRVTKKIYIIKRNHV